MYFVVILYDRFVLYKLAMVSSILNHKVLPLSKSILSFMCIKFIWYLEKNKLGKLVKLDVEIPEILF